MINRVPLWKLSDGEWEEMKVTDENYSHLHLRPLLEYWTFGGKVENLRVENIHTFLCYDRGMQKVAWLVGDLKDGHLGK